MKVLGAVDFGLSGPILLGAQVGMGEQGEILSQYKAEGVRMSSTGGMFGCITLCISLQVSNSLL